MLRRFASRSLQPKSIWRKTIFIRRFRRVVGQTPYAYLRTYRLALARQALASGDTLTQAAEKVGYQDAASLSRALRAMGRF